MNIISRCIRSSAILFALIMSTSASYADEFFSTDGVAINGYDAVAYFSDRKPVKGSAAFTTIYRGVTFHFASAAHRDAFAKNPENYAPQYGGYCAFGTAQGHKAPTEPQAFTVIDGKLYLNYNDDVRKTWRTDVGANIKKANDNWASVKKQPAP